MAGRGMNWSDQVAVVTGGSRGMGRATCLLLARHGAAVCVNYAARADAAEEVANEIRAAGGRAITARADVADAGALAKLVNQTEADLGPVTILVNNAGIGGAHGTLDDYDPADLARLRAVNVDGVINATRAVMTGMRARGYGRIVNISSIAAYGTTLPGTTWYAATKAAVHILTKRFAFELGKDGITVNAVAPGFVRTDMTTESQSPEQWRATEQRLAGLTISGRIGEPGDIANAVAFLAAPESGWITAQILSVDGGRKDYLPPD